MSSRPRVAVVGAGIFGCMAALALDRAGYEVVLIEKSPNILQGASHNNQNRLHRGYHYPRSPETIEQCARGFERFHYEFPEAISRDWENAYFIMQEGSLTSPDRFQEVCARHRLPLRDATMAGFPILVRNVAWGACVDEAIYDVSIIRKEIASRLGSSGVRLLLNHEALMISRTATSYALAGRLWAKTFDAVVNCTYADTNRLTEKLGFAVPVRRYEYTGQLVLEIPGCPRVGVAILDSQTDGCTLIPYGHSSLFLLYHCELSVLQTDEQEIMDPTWEDYFAPPERHTHWQDRLLSRVEKYIPIVRAAHVLSFLHGPRVVPARSDARDERPSSVTQHEPGYITVVSGKVDHCLEASDEVVRLLDARLRKECA